MWTNQFKLLGEQRKSCSAAKISDVFSSQGQLRINPKKYHEAFIPAPVSSVQPKSELWIQSAVSFLRLVKGQLAFISKESACQQDDTRDIFLDGIVARNRALNGDVVVVQLLPQDQWKVERLFSPFIYTVFTSDADGVFCVLRLYAQTQTARAPASPMSRRRTRGKRCRRSKQTELISLPRTSLSEN